MRFHTWCPPEAAFEAADRLADEGIRVEVIDAFSVKPLDVATIGASVARTGCVVTAEELCAQTGKSQDAVFKELETLFQKGFFQNCGLRRGGVPCVIIADAMNGESGVGFADVTCASCGATTRMRAGSRGHCPYCGKPIVDTKKQ